MILTCPCCAGRFSIEAALTDDQARQAVAAALKLPPSMAELLLRYLTLFRPEKRALSWARAAKLLTELVESIDAGQVERNGRAWAAPHALWKAALEEMLEKRERLTLPLKGHGYLFEVVAAKSAKAEGTAEQRREDARRHPTTPRQGGMQQVGKMIAKPDPEELEKRRQELRAAAGSKTHGTATDGHAKPTATK